MSETYSDVDRSSNPSMAVQWQERLAEWPDVRAYKSRTLELLGPSGPFLDVGCGPGTDVVALPGQQAVGIDSSRSMCAAAMQRGAVACCADAHALPFADSVFGGVRADRVVQHLDEPEAALHEMVRVVAGRGRVVVADPDQESLVIQVPGVRPSVLDRLKALRRDVGYRNGRNATRLPQLFDRVGLCDIVVEAFPLVLTDPADAFGLPKWPQTWRAQGGFTDEELDEWASALRHPRPGFLYSVSFFVVAGTKRQASSNVVIGHQAADRAT